MAFRRYNRICFCLRRPKTKTCIDDDDSDDDDYYSNYDCYFDDDDDDSFVTIDLLHHHQLLLLEIDDDFPFLHWVNIQIIHYYCLVAVVVAFFVVWNIDGLH